MGEDTKALRRAVAALAGEDAVPGDASPHSLHVTDKSGRTRIISGADKAEIWGDGFLFVLSPEGGTRAVFAPGAWDHVVCVKVAE